VQSKKRGSLSSIADIIAAIERDKVKSRLKAAFGSAKPARVKSTEDPLDTTAGIRAADKLRKSKDA